MADATAASPSVGVWEQLHSFLFRLSSFRPGADGKEPEPVFHPQTPAPFPPPPLPIPEQQRVALFSHANAGQADSQNRLSATSASTLYVMEEHAMDGQWIKHHVVTGRGGITRRTGAAF